MQLLEFSALLLHYGMPCIIAMKPCHFFTPWAFSSLRRTHLQLLYVTHVFCSFQVYVSEGMWTSGHSSMTTPTWHAPSLIPALAVCLCHLSCRTYWGSIIAQTFFIQHAYFSSIPSSGQFAPILPLDLFVAD